MKKINIIKKYLTILLLTAILFTRIMPVYALDIPEAPSAPTAPSAPSAPEAPKAPEAPSAPTAPSAPETPTVPSEITADTTEQEGTSSNGGVGDTAINTGDANSDTTLQTTGNSNLGITNGEEGGSISVSNSGNGAGSLNDVSGSVINNNNTNQGNSATVNNNLNQATATGQNSASYNVGDSSITTGDANTTGTVITSVNTNVDGVAVAEFNIADDHIGDIVLDFGQNCVNGCSGSSVTASNENNGASSNNQADASNTTNNNTNQTNNAGVSNELILAADSGSNNASFNTGGDSDIVTGDANVSANSLTFANNNLAGNVIYGVVNIFGNLVGDIILTEEAMNAICGGSCGGSTTASNTGNGANSTNTASATSTNTDNTFQSNDASITNTLVLDAQTGNNDTNFNTGGDSSINTGDASVMANVLNIANSNLIGGNWWLVIVNQAGKWVGKIIGSPDGSTLAGSSGTEFVVDPITGEVTAMNNTNGADSTNTVNSNQTTNNSINQTNNANINNTLNLSANTGNNTSSFNTGGNSNITTGDAKIIANIVNFVNNNIVGNGKLVVTMINVFGSWFGDFVAPGQTKEKTVLADQSQAESVNQEQNNTSGIGGTNSETILESIDTDSVNSDNKQTENVAEPTESKVFIASNNNGSFASILVAGVSDHIKDTLGKNLTGEKAKVKAVNINLAWLIILIPGIALLLFLGKKIKRLPQL